MKKLAILSNTNMDPLRNHLQRFGFPDLYFAGYNQWQSDLLNPESGLSIFAPDNIFIHLYAEEFNSEISDLFDSIEFYSNRNPGVNFIVSDFSYPPYSVQTYISRANKRELELNQALYAFAEKNSNLFILNFNRLISLHGYNTLFDDKFWYLGRIIHSSKGFAILATELNNIFNCLLGKTKKVLILDLDNTLWGGVVGELGWQNIQLSQEGVGRIYLDFQKKIKQLQQTGVLLAICSKNNENDIREVFENNKNMILTLEDFTCHEINWNNKFENITRIADSLSLGTDSMVFIDDNPVERDLVAQSLPAVIVADFPKDISTLNKWFVTEVVYPYFSKRKLTIEDTNKTDQYKRNFNREVIKKQLDYTQFIKELNIRLTIFEPTADFYFRMAQLTQKTNQFNLTAKRYSDTEIKSMAENKEYKIFGCEYEDKFGKEGIIGCAIIKIEKDTAIIDSFLLSCRVLGRRVEFTFLDNIIQTLKKLEIKTVKAFYTETDRNNQTKDFYTKYGFKALDGNKFTISI